MDLKIVYADKREKAQELVSKTLPSGYRMLNNSMNEGSSVKSKGWLAYKMGKRS